MSITLYGAAGGQGVTTIAAAVAAHDAQHKRTVVEFDNPGELDDFRAALGVAQTFTREGEQHEILPNLIVQYRYHRFADHYGLREPVDLYVTRHPIADDHSYNVCVIKPCYLALRRFVSSDWGHLTDSLIVHNEPNRALGVVDIERATGVNVSFEIDHDPAIARAVDAGLLAARMPAQLQRLCREIWQRHAEHLTREHA